MKKKVTLFILSLFALLGTANAQDDVMPVDEVLMSIPSPLEISVLIKEFETNYNKDDLNNPQSAYKYKTSFQQALNMGVYGVNLVYANSFGQKEDALNYLNSMEFLARSLDIKPFINFEETKQYLEVSTPLDSIFLRSDNLRNLLKQTTVNFEKVNRHLRVKKREDISILSLTGFWVEALYLTVLLDKKLEFDILKHKIANQKIVLEQLLLVLNVYQSKSSFPSLLEGLTKLQEVYDTIEVEIIPAEPKNIDPYDCFPVISTDQITVKVTDSHIKQITALITNIRNKIINNGYN